jgi:hypothetical protein
VRENDGLPGSPIFVIDLGTVFYDDFAHASFSYLLSGDCRACSDTSVRRCDIEPTVHIYLKDADVLTGAGDTYIFELSMITTSIEYHGNHRNAELHFASGQRILPIHNGVLLLFVGSEMLRSRRSEKFDLLKDQKPWWRLWK